MSTTRDGGYYAIKGFAFQIDKSILEILKAEESASINIEKIQDIDSDSFVMQIKYKEARAFTPSEIKKPVLQLLEEFKENQDKKYYLYAYFNDFKNYNDFVDESKKITIENLDKILGNQKDEYQRGEKEFFISKFVLDFAPDFQTQFEGVISELSLNITSSSDEETIFYYANICHFLQGLVVRNENKENRT